MSPFRISRPLDAFLFSPQEAEQERAAKALTHRRPGQKPTPRLTERRLGSCYNGDAYRRAISRACLKAGVPFWHPHQLRHNAATLIRKSFGLEAAQILLGHAHADVTQIYAEVNEAKAVEVAHTIG